MTEKHLSALGPNQTRMYQRSAFLCLSSHYHEMRTVGKATCLLARGRNDVWREIHIEQSTSGIKAILTDHQNHTIYFRD